MAIKPCVVNIAVSVDIGVEGDFGKGTKSFQSISGRYPDPGVPLEELDDVIDVGMDYYYAAWKSLLQSRYITGSLSGKDLQAKFAIAEARIKKLHKFLQELKEEKGIAE